MARQSSTLPQIAPWQEEFENTSRRYHFIAAWVAVIFDPLFAFTDYINIPGSWRELLIIRMCVSITTLIVLILRDRYQWPWFVIAVVPFMMISLQNAYTYSLINNDALIGHNLNYIALLIGGAMFLAWTWHYSVVALLISCIATAYFVKINPSITLDEFFLEGGLLLFAVAVFMLVLIQTRYNLTIREIKARLALELSNKQIQIQNQELQEQDAIIKGINENLEQLVKDRTAELEKKNKALEEYAFINAHKLRSPVASILGLVNLFKKTDLSEDGRILMDHLSDSADRLDSIVNSITRAIEKAD